MVYRFIKNNPGLFFLILMLIHYLSAYPGGMTADSYHQFFQSVRVSYDSHHPPMMAMVWSVFNIIYKGPQTILFLHLVMLWSSVFILYKTDENNKFRWLYFILPFIPSVLSESAMVWKDVGFANGFLLVFAICTYYTYRKEKPPMALLIGIILIYFYATAVKFQAKFTAPILALFIVSLFVESWLKRIIACIILSIVVIGANTLIIRYLTLDTHGEQLRQFFDLAGIAIDIDDDSIIPAHVKEKPIYSFEKVKAAYHPESVNHMVFVEDTKVFNGSLDESDIATLNSAFYSAVTTYPISYLKHRKNNLSFVINRFNVGKYSESPMGSPDFVPEFHKFDNNVLQELFAKYLSKAPKFSHRNKSATYLLSLYTVVMLYIVIRRRLYEKLPLNTEHIVLFYAIAIGFGHLLTLFFTTMASDYRYFMIIRIITFFSLPIFLKLVLLRKNEILKN